MKIKKILLWKKENSSKNQLIVLPNGKDIVDVVAGEAQQASYVYFVKLIKNLNPTIQWRQSLSRRKVN
jgi:hypothetical protein